MNELIKIAQSNQTHLEKCAGIAALFHDGVISAEEGDMAAVEMGIEPSDVASVYTANYGDMEKTASAESTYLEKTAAVADYVASGDIQTEEALFKIAEENDLAISDISAVYSLAYGDDLQKTAALEEAEHFLTDADTTYLQKTAAVSALYMDDLIDADDTVDTASNLDLDIRDIYSELEKNAADEEKKESLIESLKGKMAKGGNYVKDKAVGSADWVKKNPKTAAAIGLGGAALGAGGVYAKKQMDDREQ